MNDLGNRYTFKSLPKYFWKERDDVKNNIVRRIDLDDVRFRELIAWSEIGFNDGDVIICIVCDRKGITRHVRDVTLWDGFMIITWHPTTGVK